MVFSQALSSSNRFNAIAANLQVGYSTPVSTGYPCCGKHSIVKHNIVMDSGFFCRNIVLHWDHLDSVWSMPSDSCVSLQIQMSIWQCGNPRFWNSMTCIQAVAYPTTWRFSMSCKNSVFFWLNTQLYLELYLDDWRLFDSWGCCPLFLSSLDYM